jgi:hypothetical protein
MIKKEPASIRVSVENIELLYLLFIVAFVWMAWMTKMLNTQTNQCVEMSELIDTHKRMINSTKIAADDALYRVLMLEAQLAIKGIVDIDPRLYQ